MYIEITGIPPLTARQRALLEAHTLLNMYSVIRAELLHLGSVLAGNERLLRTGVALCDTCAAALDRPESLVATVASVNDQEKRVFREIETRMRDATEHRAGVADSVANLRTLFALLRQRARELLARKTAVDPWARVPVALLEAEFRDMFAAVEQNSHGRYRILFTSATQRSHDYHLSFEIDAENRTSVVLPAVFTDVIRDLVANARKYTAPGGRIRAALRSSAHGLRLVVEDNGRGIPPQEIPKVVHFGVRGSNVRDIRSMGGGFGLTKAYVVTKHFGGRMWIDSELGAGTRIRISLPPPPASAQAAARPLTSALASSG